jgi:hypothetical protein
MRAENRGQKGNLKIHMLKSAFEVGSGGASCNPSTQKAGEEDCVQVQLGWWECKLVQPLWKTIWRLLKKLNINLPYDPAIPL